MENLLSFLILSPVCMAIGAFFLRKKGRSIHTYIGATTLWYALLTFLAIYALREVIFGSQTFQRGEFLFVNQTNAIFIVLIMSLSFVINYYAGTYFKREVAQHHTLGHDKDVTIGYGRLSQYPILSNMFIFSMLFVALSNNLISMWIGLEATTIFTTFLISMYGSQTSREAAWKYTIICSVGLTVGLFGLFLMLYSGLPTLDVSYSLAHAVDIGTVNASLLQFAFLVVVIGLGTKAAFFPVNTWLPDAHGKAPSPISAFMSSILLPLALYVIIRAKEIVDIVVPGFANNVLLIVGLVTLVYTGFTLLQQKHFKRALAYSSSEHIAIITLAFALNAPLLAFAHLIFHSFVKAASFMSAGNILLELGSGQFKNIKNIFSYMKYTPLLLIVSLIFLMGIPPSYLFVTEIWLIVTAYSQSIRIALVITVALLLATSGLFLNFGKMFEAESEEEPLTIKRCEEDFHRNTLHQSLLITLLFPVLFIVLASIGFGRWG